MESVMLLSFSVLAWVVIPLLLNVFIKQQMHLNKLLTFWMNVSYLIQAKRQITYNYTFYFWRVFMECNNSNQVQY